MKVTLISYTQNPIETCAKCAAVCYDSKPSFNIVKGCIRSGHSSILEHANYTFKIEEVSRALLAQITRHRIASYSVRSQRYCTEAYNNESGLNFVTPTSVMNEEQYEIYRDAIENSFNKYEELLSKDIKPEDARMVLPNACNTTIMMTMNLRSLGNFMGERLCTRAQWEIRRCAELMRKEILKTMTKEEADFFQTYWLAPKCMQHRKPLCEEQKSCGRAPSIYEYCLASTENKKGEI